jgi:putative endopeptidase
MTMNAFKVLSGALLFVTFSLGLATPVNEETVHGINPAYMDTTVSACVNFNQYANGGWMASHPIPPEFPSYGTFRELADRSEVTLHQILETAASRKDARPGSDEQKIGDFYASCMDTAQVESEGAKPLQPEFDRINQIHDLPSLRAEVAHLHGYGAGVLFRFSEQQDRKDSTQVIASAFQGGMGLPERGYYFRKDEKSQKIRDAYVKHIASMFALLGDDADKAAAESQTVMALETKLAQSAMDRIQMRDPDATYHKMALAELQGLTPNFSWEAYLGELGYPQVKEVNVGQPKFFGNLNELLASVPLDDWKTYLRWHVIAAAAPALSDNFVQEDFNFRSRVLQGTEKIQERWKRCVQATNFRLGFALGKLYVKEEFPPEAKARADKMVHFLIAALRDDIQTLPWMGPETKKAALAKLDAFTPKIGYPDKWRDYSAFKVDRGPFVENVLRGDLFEFHRSLNKIGKPVDRGEWGMTPPTVNAYYNPSMNEIVFPAGILQPPFFDPKADDAVNYGGIGAVIGHEMTHGFDDEGRKFDAHGNRADWWTADDVKNFQERATCVEKQFDAYVAIDDIHEKGKLVLGESIADLGGLTIAYKAYQKSLQGKPRPPKINGLTPEQRFFLSFAQIWAGNDRPEYIRLQVNTNPHPLHNFRAIAAPSNMPMFQQAFGCKAGDPMVREERCTIW